MDEKEIKRKVDAYDKLVALARSMGVDDIWNYDEKIRVFKEIGEPLNDLEK